MFPSNLDVSMVVLFTWRNIFEFKVFPVSFVLLTTSVWECQSPLFFSLYCLVHRHFYCIVPLCSLSCDFLSSSCAFSSIYLFSVAANLTFSSAIVLLLSSIDFPSSTRELFNCSSFYFSFDHFCFFYELFFFPWGAMVVNSFTTDETLSLCFLVVDHLWCI